MEIFLIIFSIAIVTLGCIWKWLKSIESLEDLRVPHEKPVPFIGKFLPFFLRQDSPINTLEKQYHKFPNDNFIGIYGALGKYSLALKHPELVKKVFIKDFDHFVNRGPIENSLGSDYLLGKSVLLMKNQEWRDMRTLLSPIYTSSKMKYMFGLLTDCADEFINLFEKKAKTDKTEIDTHDVFARVTADGIATTALGFKGDCVANESSKLFEIVQAVETDFTRMFTDKNVFRPSVHEFFETNILSEINRRREGKIVRPDVIQLLVQAFEGRLKLEAGDEEELSYVEKTKKIVNWSDDDLVAQAFVLFLGGYDTTATMMQGMCFELAHHPEVQETLKCEVDDMMEKLDGKTISYDELNKLKFVDMVINETLRKWPSFRAISRTCIKDYVLKDDETGKSYKIKKGTEVLLPIRYIQMDPRFYKDPEVFDPFRFSDENKGKIPSGAYVPFGMGPRVCLGSRYALLEGKLLLFYLMAKFSIEKCSKTPDKITHNVGNTGYNEKIYVALKLRK